MTCRRPYDTDLTDREWEQLKPLVPLAEPGGRPPIHSRREILNGIFYAVRSGCAWKLLPHCQRRHKTTAFLPVSSLTRHGPQRGGGRDSTAVSTSLGLRNQTKWSYTWAAPRSCSG
jgi:putative transposase